MEKGQDWHIMRHATEEEEVSSGYENLRLCNIQKQQHPFYGHDIGQPVLASTSVKN